MKAISRAERTKEDSIWALMKEVDLGVEHGKNCDTFTNPCDGGPNTSRANCAAHRSIAAPPLKFFSHQKRAKQGPSEPIRLPQKPFSAIGDVQKRKNYDTTQKQAFAYAFTRKTLRTKEDILSFYINRAIEELREQLETTNTVDMVPIFGNALLDLSCKLTVDRDLGAINPHGTTHPCLEVIHQASRYLYIPVQMLRLPRIISYPIQLFRRFLAKGIFLIDPFRVLAKKRVQHGGADNDFVSYMTFEKGGKKSVEKIINNTAVIIAASAETTTSWLCASMYYALINPLVLSKPRSEIRSAAQDVSDLNLDLLYSMTYLKACMEESIRIYPPVTGTFTRMVPKGGSHICGKHIPENTVVGVHQWATYHNANNFKHPDDFRPERWFDGNNEYANDRRNALQPFSYGPRKCIGNELATMNAKLFFARLLWEFDIELEPTSCDWANQKGHTLPYRQPLWVKVKRRNVKD
ncbi:hypothetical protein V502_00308 [Pseudogymnoascus sp. VKM F-4520 (FW-2644)]|nr:hypothetical protein V502_00308 [Pseudogymnoascus sp. VKM F-4520 (FW-2644)]